MTNIRALRGPDFILTADYIMIHRLLRYFNLIRVRPGDCLFIIRNTETGVSVDATVGTDQDEDAPATAASVYATSLMIHLSRIMKRPFAEVEADLAAAIEEQKRVNRLD